MLPYYINNLFYKNGRPRHFSKAKYLKLRKYEMYDYAEGIKLGDLLKDEIPNALSKSIELANDLIDNFQTKKGYFITRVTSFGTYHKVPYLMDLKASRGPSWQWRPTALSFLRDPQ